MNDRGGLVWLAVAGIDPLLLKAETLGGQYIKPSSLASSHYHSAQITTIQAQHLQHYGATTQSYGAPSLHQAPTSSQPDFQQELHTRPVAHGMMTANSQPAMQQEIYASQSQVQGGPVHPFAHLLDLPVFPIYSLSEVEIIRKALEQNADTKKERQEYIKNLPPPPTTGEALTARILYEYIGAMSDGGMTLAVRQLNINKLMAGALGTLDAMERKMMEDNETVTYSRWATPAGVRDPPVILDVLTWHSFSDHTKLRGIQVKSNADEKFKVFDKYEFSTKGEKPWGKSFFRGRYWTLSVSMVSDRTEVKLGQVVSIQRNLSPNTSVDFHQRWLKFPMPRI